MIRTANAYLMQEEITQHENCLEFQQFQNRNLVECRQEQKYGVLILSKKKMKKNILKMTYSDLHSLLTRANLP